MSDTVQLRLTPAEIRALDQKLDVEALDHPLSHLKPGVLSAHGIATVGDDGFLFLSDGANRWERQYAGAAPAEPWLAKWLEVLAKRQQAAAEHRVELWNLVIPEKQVLYPEKRWPSDAPDSSNRPLRRILSGVSDDARLLYAEAALGECKREQLAYARRDSHWSASGCLAVARMLLAKVAPRQDLETLSFMVEKRRQPRDLVEHFFAPAPAEEHLVIGFDGERVFDNRVYETGRFNGSAYIVRTAHAPDPRRVVVFGDSYSFSVGLVGALTSVFAEVTFVWSKAVLWNVVAERPAELVIWESAERFLVTNAEA